METNRVIKNLYIFGLIFGIITSSLGIFYFIGFAPSIFESGFPSMLYFVPYVLAPLFFGLGIIC